MATIQYVYLNATPKNYPTLPMDQPWAAIAARFQAIAEESRLKTLANPKRVIDVGTLEWLIGESTGIQFDVKEPKVSVRVYIGACYQEVEAIEGARRLLVREFFDAVDSVGGSMDIQSASEQMRCLAEVA